MLTPLWQWLKGRVHITRELDSYCEREFMLKPMDGYPARLSIACITVTKQTTTYQRWWWSDTIRYDVDIVINGHSRTGQTDIRLNAHNAMSIVMSEYELKGDLDDEIE